MEQSRGPPIGIDFGTAYIRVAVSNGTKCTMIPDQHGNYAMPSYVAFTDSGMLIGEAARAQASRNPTNTIFDVIRLIGRRYSHPSVRNDTRLWPFKVIAGPDGRLQVEVNWNGSLRQYSTAEICSMLLIQIKENAEKNLKTTVTDAVITVPVRFNSEQRLTIKQAGKISGFNVLQIISAPAASAFFYGTERSKGTNMISSISHSLFLSEHNMVIFDLGAGTLDVAVVTIKENECRVQTTAGDIHLGGSDFDNNLVDYFVSKITKSGRDDISNITVAISNLRKLCEKAKISLSSGANMVPVKMRSLYDNVNFEFPLTQEKFKELNNDHFLKCIHILEMHLKDSRSIEVEAVHEVILAGSSTRIPVLKNYIQDFFKNKVLITISQHLEAATAFGAAFQAFFLGTKGNENPRCLSLLDTTPPEENSIGIDFGTTYSSVAVCQENAVTIIENEYCSCLTSSVVAFNDTSRLIGDEVHKEQLMTNPSNTIPNIKRLIGRCYSDLPVQNDSKFLPFKILCDEKNRSIISVQYKKQEKLFAPEEIAAMILTKMVEIAEAHLNSIVTKAVISVPVFFSDSQRQAIRDAGVIAGLEVLQLLNEPTAVAIAYGCQNSTFHSKQLLIFDLGGGNLDVSIVEVSSKTIWVLAVAGDTNLGGEDFDNNMVGYFVEKFTKEKQRDIRNKPRSLRKLRTACEKAKRVLSTNAEAVVEIDALDDGIDFRSSMTRRTFEEINATLFERCICCVERCLEGAQEDKSSIDEVVMVGGSTRIPKIQQILQEFFNDEAIVYGAAGQVGSRPSRKPWHQGFLPRCEWKKADEAVVYGAAVHAAILSGNDDFEKYLNNNVPWALDGYNHFPMKIKPFDVTSLSLGMCNEDGAARNLLVPIPKHTQIPTKNDLIFTNWVDGLSSFSIQVRELELESTIVFTLSSIPPKQKGNSKIIVCFEVDNSGILNLTAKDIRAKNKEIEIKVNKENGGLTMEEVQKMMEATARYKLEDEVERKRVVALNSMENFAYEMKAITKEAGLSTTSKKTVEKGADEAIAWLETNRYASIDEIIAQNKQLETIKGRIVYLGTDAS